MRRISEKFRESSEGSTPTYIQYLLDTVDELARRYGPDTGYRMIDEAEVTPVDDILDAEEDDLMDDLPFYKDRFDKELRKLELLVRVGELVQGNPEFKNILTARINRCFNFGSEFGRGMKQQATSHAAGLMLDALHIMREGLKDFDHVQKSDIASHETHQRLFDVLERAVTAKMIDRKYMTDELAHLREGASDHHPDDRHFAVICTHLKADLEALTVSAGHDLAAPQRAIA